jgi:hypothetical protein
MKIIITAYDEQGGVLISKAVRIDDDVFASSDTEQNAASTSVAMKAGEVLTRAARLLHRRGSS